MTHVTQLSAQVSESAKQLLDDFSERTGIKKNRIVEDALWFYVRARQDLPESAIVPSRMVLSEESADAVERALARPPAPTPALSRLLAQAAASDQPDHT